MKARQTRCDRDMVPSPPHGGVKWFIRALHTNLQLSRPVCQLCGILACRRGEGNNSFLHSTILFSSAFHPSAHLLSSVPCPFPILSSSLPSSLPSTSHPFFPISPCLPNPTSPPLPLPRMASCDRGAELAAWHITANSV